MDLQAENALLRAEIQRLKGLVPEPPVLRPICVDMCLELDRGANFEESWEFLYRFLKHHITENGPITSEEVDKWISELGNVDLYLKQNSDTLV
jgi:hypothetical protein